MNKKVCILKRLASLRQVLIFHEYRYYILNDPLLSDKEYDILYKALEKLESENPEIRYPGFSHPAGGQGLTKNFPTVNHLVPMFPWRILTMQKTWWTGTGKPGS